MIYVLEWLQCSIKKILLYMESILLSISFSISLFDTQDGDSFSISLFDTQDGDTPLHGAVYYGRRDSLRFLLEAGVDYTRTNKVCVT